eukprot:486131-Amphidinium_carterae.1
MVAWTDSSRCLSRVSRSAALPVTAVALLGARLNSPLLPRSALSPTAVGLPLLSCSAKPGGRGTSLTVLLAGQRVVARTACSPAKYCLS